MSQIGPPPSAGLTTHVLRGSVCCVGDLLCRTSAADPPRTPPLIALARHQLAALEDRVYVPDEPLFSISVDTGLEVRRPPPAPPLLHLGGDRGPHTL